MNTLHHYDRITEYLRLEEVWLLLAEKLVMDSDRRRLVSTSAFLRSGITLYSDHFIILKIDILYQILSDSQVNIQVEDSEDHLLGRRLLRTLWEMLPDNFAAYPFIHAGEFYMLLNFKESLSKRNPSILDKAIETLYKSCQCFVAEVLSDMNHKVRVYISPYISSMDKMAFKFETLNNMAKADFSLTENLDVVLPPDTRQMQTAENTQRVAQVASLTTGMLKSALEHRFGEALTAANDLIELESSSYDTALSLPIRMGSRIECLFDILGIPPANTKHPSLRVYEYKELLLESTSVLDMKETISKMFSDFEEYFAPASPPSPVKNRMDEICTYINNNYSDSNLCSDMICQKFGISGAYLSRLFKEQMGVKLIDYIHHLRIEEASKLLQDTSYTVEQVAHKVGYHSALTLTRAYKRYCNMSPGSARKQQ